MSSINGSRMDILNILITFALLLATVPSVLAIYLMRTLPATTLLRLSTILLLLIMSSNHLFLTIFPFMPAWYLISAGVLTHVIEVWGMAVCVRLLLSISPWRDPAHRYIWLVLKYLPAMFLTVLVTGGAALNPTWITVTWTAGLPDIFYGPMDVAFLSSGFLYLLLTLVLILRMLSMRLARIQRELLWLLSIILLGIIPIVMWICGYRVSTSASAIFLLLSSLLGVVISYAVIKKSPLIIPQKEVAIQQKEEPDENNEPLPSLNPGGMYLFSPDERETARRCLLTAVNEGKHGLWVTRKHPRDLRKAYGLVKTPFIWLTSAKTEDETCIDPKEITRLTQYISSFISDAASGYIILLEGLEYVHSTTGFQGTLRFIQYLNDKVMTTGGILLISTDPAAFQKGDYAMLASEAAQTFGELSAA
jgi:hypothetical protein